MKAFIYDVHPRTLEAKARCKTPGSCHDCAMTCQHGNLVLSDTLGPVPCGTESVFDTDGHIKLCDECRHDQMMYWKGMAP